MDVRRGELEQERQGERLLGVPAPIDGGLADAGAGGDVLEAQPREALLDEELASCLEDRPADPLAARSAARPADDLGGDGGEVLPVQGHDVTIRHGP